MQVPPSYCGSRLVICLMLSIGVAAFFLIYDGVTHRGMPSVSDSLKSRTIVARPNPIHGYGGFNESPAPDMNSPEVKFAGADVLQGHDALAARTVAPRKSESKPKQRVRSVQRQKAKPTQIVRIKVRSEGRAAYAESYSPGFGMFRQF
jgi:hypothetical protein